MGTDLVIASRLPAPAVIEHLAAFGRDWRESKLPESIRREGIFGCTIAVSGDTFDLALEPQARGPSLAWRGTVVPGHDDHGASIRLSWRLTPVNFLGYAIFLALLTLIDRDVGLAAAISMGVVIGAINVLGAFWQASRQAPLCREIIQHVVGLATDSSSRGVPG